MSTKIFIRVEKKNKFKLFKRKETILDKQLLGNNEVFKDDWLRYLEISNKEYMNETEVNIFKLAEVLTLYYVGKVKKFTEEDWKSHKAELKDIWSPYYTRPDLDFVGQAAINLDMIAVLLKRYLPSEIKVYIRYE